MTFFSNKATLCAKSYQKCENAPLEIHDDATMWFMKAMELEKGETANIYNENAKAEAKQLGNAHCWEMEFNEANTAHEDAVKRARKNAIIQNNLYVTFCKIEDYKAEKREIEVALELDPNCVKAWSNKADIELLLNEKHKAMDCYRKWLNVDPTSKVC